MESNAPVESTVNPTSTSQPDLQGEAYEAPKPPQQPATTSSEKACAETVAEHLDSGDSRAAKEALLECVQGMTSAQEVKELFSEMQKHDDKNVGLDIVLYDSNNQVTEDITEAKQWGFVAQPESTRAESENDPDADVKEVVRFLDEEGSVEKAEAALANIMTDTVHRMQEDPDFDGKAHIREKILKIDELEKNGVGADAVLLDGTEPTEDPTKANNIMFKGPESESAPETMPEGDPNAVTPETTPESNPGAVTPETTPEQQSVPEFKEAPSVDEVVSILDNEKDAAKADAAIKKLVEEQKFREILEIDAKEQDGKGKDLKFVDAQGNETKEMDKIANYVIVDGEPASTDPSDKSFEVQPPTEGDPNTVAPETKPEGDPNAVTPEAKPEATQEVSEEIKNIVNTLDVEQDAAKAKAAMQAILDRGDGATLFEIDKLEKQGVGQDLIFTDDAGNKIEPLNQDGTLNVEAAQKITKFDVVAGDASSTMPPESNSETPPETAPVQEAAHPLLKTNLFLPEGQRPELFSLIDRAGDTDKENEQNDGLISKGDIGKLIDNRWFALLDPQTQESLKTLKDADWDSDAFKALKQDGYLSLEKIRAAGDALPPELANILSKSYISADADSRTMLSLIDLSKGNDEQRIDGKVKERDTSGFIENKMNFLVSPETLQYVENLKQQLADDSEEVKKIKDGDGYITIETINLALARDSVNSTSETSPEQSPSETNPQQPSSSEMPENPDSPVSQSNSSGRLPDTNSF